MQLLHTGNVEAATQTYTLTSPIDGDLWSRNIAPGMEVQGQYGGGTAQELFTVGDVSTVWVVGDLYEVDLARVHVGAAALVTVISQRDQVFRATVDWISSVLDPDTRTAKVRCTLQNPDKLLRPQMYATLELSVDQQPRLAIPSRAVIRLGEYRVVFVRVGEMGPLTRFERVPVEIDERESGDWREVKHGLTAGQKVVVGGVQLLSRQI